MFRLARLASVATLASIVLAACTSNSSPEPSTPVPTSSASGLESPTETPSAGPVINAVKATRGSATVRVEGDIKEQLSIPIGLHGLYQPNPGEFSLSYVSREGDALIVSGPTPAETAKTSADLTLSIVVQTNTAHAFPSSQGECTIEVKSASAQLFSATFLCKHLSAKGKTISANGQFTAAPD